MLSHAGGDDLLYPGHVDHLRYPTQCNAFLARGRSHVIVLTPDYGHHPFLQIMRFVSAINREHYFKGIDFGIVQHGRVLHPIAALPEDCENCPRPLIRFFDMQGEEISRMFGGAVDDFRRKLVELNLSDSRRVTSRRDWRLYRLVERQKRVFRSGCSFQNSLLNGKAMVHSSAEASGFQPHYFEILPRQRDDDIGKKEDVAS